MERPIHNVLLSSHWLERAGGNKETFKLLVGQYMRMAYPNYRVKTITKKEECFVAICERVK